MDLTFTRGVSANFTGKGEDGTTLFTIRESLVLVDDSATLRVYLPGFPDRIAIAPPDGALPGGKVTREKAMRVAADSLEQWASKVLGVALAVNVVDNT